MDLNITVYASSYWKREAFGPFLPRISQAFAAIYHYTKDCIGIFTGSEITGIK